jgi:hypothetical protein
MPKKHEKIIKTHTREKKLIRIVVIGLTTIIAVAFITYAVALLNQNMGGFTINLNYRNLEQGGLFLYDNSLFNNPSSTLKVDGLRYDMRDMSYTWFGTRLPSIEEIDNVDGAFNFTAEGDNEVSFLSYTFYVKNDTADTVITYSSSITMLGQAKGVDEAMRIIVVEDSISFAAQGNERIYTVFGKESKSGGLDPLMDKMFNPAPTLIYFEKEIQPGEAHKYTIILYLEGEDPECINDILGGMVRLSWDFLVL